MKNTCCISMLGVKKAYEFLKTECFLNRMLWKKSWNPSDILVCLTNVWCTWKSLMAWKIVRVLQTFLLIHLTVETKTFTKNGISARHCHNFCLFSDQWSWFNLHKTFVHISSRISHRLQFLSVTFKMLIQNDSVICKYDAVWICRRYYCSFRSEGWQNIIYMLLEKSK